MLLVGALPPHVLRGDQAQGPVFFKAMGAQGRLGTLNSPGGLAAVDTEGGTVVYIVDAGNARVQAVSASGQVIGAFGRRGDAPDGFWAPSDLALSPDGRFVYVVDRRHRLVQQFEPTPQCLEGRGRCFVRAWGGWGVGPGQFQEPTGIAVDGAGRLYVADWGGHVVQVFDAGGAHIRTFGRVGVGRGELLHPTDVAVAADGSVWVADRDNDRLSVFDARGEFVTTHTLGDRLHYPVGLAFGPDGSFAVADYEAAYGQGRLRIFSADRKLQREQVVGGDGRKFDYPPMGVAVVPERGVMATVASGPQSGVALLPPNGELSWWGERGRALDQFVFPWAVAIDPLFLAVVDSGNSRVLVVEGGGGDRVLHVLGGELAPQFDFGDPRGVAVWRNGPQLEDAVILVADQARNVIVRGTPGGRRLDSWGTGEPTDARNGFRNPLDVAVGPDGVTYVADTGNDRVVRRAPDGEVLGTIGPFASGPVELVKPAAVAVGADGLIYVLELSRSRLQAFTPEGEHIGIWASTDTRDVEPGLLWLPVALASDERYLYVLENESIQQGSAEHVRVQVFQPVPGRPLAECLQAVFANVQGAGEGRLWNPRGIAAADGWVALADSGNNRLQLFRWLDQGFAPPPIVPSATPTQTDTPTPTATPSPTGTDEPRPTEPLETPAAAATETVDVPPTPSATPPRPTEEPEAPTAAASPTTSAHPTASPAASRPTDVPTAEPSATATHVRAGATPTLSTPFADSQPRRSRRVCFLPITVR